MLHRPLNPHLDAVTQYDDLVAAASRRYGAHSQAVGYVLYEELVFLRQRLSEDPGALVLRARAAEIGRSLQEYYRLADDDLTAHPTRRVGDDPVVIEFDLETFHRLGYAGVADEVVAETVTLDNARPVGWSAGRLYLYVIDDEQRIRVWLRAFRYPDLVFGAARARIRNVPIAHPMLVPERLRAVAAGEVVFVGDREIAAVVANTRSGHFRPPPSCAGLVRRRFADVLGISERDVDVIVVS